MKILGIEFSIFDVPIERRLQTLSVCFFVFLFLQGLTLLGYATFIYLLFTRFYLITLVYIVWYYFDLDICHCGGRPWLPSRKWRVWKYLADYFPVELIKTQDLDPNRNYIFGIHPHGVMSIAAFVNFGTEATGFSKKFEGLTSHLLTLNGQFYGPFMREFFMLCGSAAASVRSLKWILENKGNCNKKGQVCVLIVGGAAESLEAHPGKFKLILNHRTGFIRIAMQTGACLVPVISFGENDLYIALPNPKGSKLRSIQEKIKRSLGFGLPIIHGRGVFNYSFGFLPYRRHVYTVVGKPIEVKLNSNPTEEAIKSLHSLYVQELAKLFDEHKHKYISNADSVNLEIE
jgi:2-acylglycerol O-acyltransferase 2